MHGFTVEDGLWRFETTLNSVDPNYVEMLVEYEDKRFFSHSGVDLRSVIRASLQAVKAGEIVSGASTLTMQVARLLEDGPTGTLRGKLRQSRVALALERVLNKDQILSLYLTLAPFGGNLEGVRAASLRYFDKPPKRLSQAEAALLIAIPQSPETRRPDRNPDITKTAAQRVLKRLGMPQEIGTNIAKNYAFPALMPHSSRNLMQQHSEHHPLRTTIDFEVQKKMEDLAISVSAGLDARASVALFAMDYTTGEVVSSVGSPNSFDHKRDGFVNMTQALRSPGSTLKPLIYGMGFDAGIAHPETVFEDRPISFGPYAPQNFDGFYRGNVRLRQALQMSLNTSAVVLADKVGPARVMLKLRQSGAKPVVPNKKARLAIALGGFGVSLQDMTGLYAGIANQGVSVSPHWILGQPEKRTDNRLLSTKAAWYVTDILRGVPPPANAPHKALAYKTGTSYGHRDAWAIGYDGRHVVGVWIGRPDGTPVPGVFGGEVAAPVLFQAFSRLKAEFAPFEAPPSDALLVPNMRLPKPLQRLQSSHDADVDPDAPVIMFPPTNTQVAYADILTVKVQNGQAPFQMILNGALTGNRQYQRNFDVQDLAQGFHEITVIDSLGRSAKTRIELR